VPARAYRLLKEKRACHVGRHLAKFISRLKIVTNPQLVTNHCLI
jgi:hypothetical protein